MANYAIVLGIDRYATDLESLTGAVADAHDFASWLIESGEVPAENLRLATLPIRNPPPLPALLQGCVKVGTKLDDLDTLLIGWLDFSPDNIERLYFFFSGHGASSSNALYPEEAICLEDFSDKSYGKTLEVSSLIAVLNAIPARERFIFIDGCRDALFQDDVQFGRLSRKPKPAREQRKNFVLRATGPGRKAAEANGRGLFSKHLCDGLRGAGNAKRWDPNLNGGGGGYSVRWRALAEYVSNAVATQRGAKNSDQLIFEDGEHPAGTDPPLATFKPEQIEPSRVAVRLLAPPKPPQQTRICLRRNDTIEEVDDLLPETGVVEFNIPPSGWVLWATADGWRSQPKSKPLLVYASRVDETISMEQLPVHSVYYAAPAAAGPDGAPPPKPLNSKEGRTRLTVGQKSLGKLLPAIRVAVRRENGDVVCDPVMTNELILDEGMYRVRLDLPGGLWSETALLVRPGDDEELDLALPDATTSALEQVLVAGGKTAPTKGFAEPSEALGQLVAPSVATVAALAAVQAVQNYQWGLVSLQIGQRWNVDNAIGLEILIADERDKASLVDANKQHVRLWRMFVSNSAPVTGKFTQTNPDAPIASTSIVLEPGGYWLQVRDFDRTRRAGFKLATRVFPGHVTVVIRNPQRSGTVPLLQFAVRRDPSDRSSIQLGIVQGEAVQRTRAAGRDPLADPAVMALAKGEWFEPISALIAAAVLLERGGDAEAMFTKVLAILDKHGTQGPDVAVLHAAHAMREGQDAEAAELIRGALGMQEVPIVQSLLERLVLEAQRLGHAGKAVDWIEEKLLETVGHPLWTLRREDDKRHSGRPDAV